jgi:HEAT repeat protein
MKRKIITILVFLIGMAVFAQNADLSFYTEELNRTGSTFLDRLHAIENVRDLNLTGIGEFYHGALKALINKIPDIKNKEDWDANENAARIVLQALIVEKYAPAAPEIWTLVEYFDIAHEENDGGAMQDAILALGQTGDQDYVYHIVLVLDDCNTHQTPDFESRRRIQRAAAACIISLEAMHAIDGYRPVFFAYIGWYDPSIRNMAHDALPNIVDDPGDVIIDIIRDNINNSNVKLRAWQEMLRTNASDSSKAKVAAVALEMGWRYPTSNTALQRDSKLMRLSAIDTIRILGVADDSVYTNLDTSYHNNFATNNPDFDEMFRVVDALSAVKTDESVALLVKFINELNERRRGNVWSDKERRTMQYIVRALGATGTQSAEARFILTTISNSQEYTGAEQTWARDALRQLGN